METTKYLDQRTRRNSAIVRGREIAATMERENLTLQEMADRLGLTRQRVHQLVKKAGGTWRKQPPRKSDWSDFIVECSYCGGKYVEIDPGVARNQRAWTNEHGLTLGIQAHCREAGHPNPRRSYIYMSRAVADDYQAGMRVSELMEKYNFKDKENVYHHLKRWKIKPRYERGDPHHRPIGRDEKLQRQIAEELRQTGKAVPIALRYGVSADRVRQIGVKYGVPRRSRS